MTKQQHPITPSPELLQLWFEQYHDYGRGLNELLIDAARYGADQELEACCEFIQDWFGDPQYRVAELRAARRPKPPSLKQQALEALDRMWNGGSTKTDWELFRRALEALPDD